MWTSEHKQRLISKLLIFVLAMVGVISIWALFAKAKEVVEASNKFPEKTYTYNQALQGYAVEYQFDINESDWHMMVIRVEGKRFLIVHDGNSMAMHPLPDEFKATHWDGQLCAGKECKHKSHH